MISVQTRVRKQTDAAKAVQEGVDDALMDAVTAGSNRMQEIVAAEATDTGQLLRSHILPERLSDGSIVTGFAAEYAKWVDRGTRPHWMPIQPLLGWARRTLGDEDAAYAVQRKIADEGTDPVHFMREGVQTIKARLQVRGLSAAIQERL